MRLSTSPILSGTIVLSAHWTSHGPRPHDRSHGPDVSHDLSTKLQQSTQPQAPLRGSVLVLIQFDVCEEIRLDELRKIFPARKVEASFKKAPAYVRYQRHSRRGDP